MPIIQSFICRICFLCCIVLLVCSYYGIIIAQVLIDCLYYQVRTHTHYVFFYEMVFVILYQLCCFYFELFIVNDFIIMISSYIFFIIGHFMRDWYYENCKVYLFYLAANILHPERKYSVSDLHEKIQQNYFFVFCLLLVSLYFILWKQSSSYFLLGYFLHAFEHNWHATLIHCCRYAGIIFHHRFSEESIASKVGLNEFHFVFSDTC